MSIVFSILFCYQLLGFHNVPLDRWLVQVKPNESFCLDQWWSEQVFNTEKCFKKKLPINSWFVLQIPRNFSDSLKSLSCVQLVLVDEILENRNTIPNDLQYPNQSNMNLIGMPNAWDLSTGGLSSSGDTIVIAVIDNGFQTDHEDLVENMWYNSKEIPNDEIDNDLNGFVDDYYGVNIKTGQDNHQNLSHGTSVSGIIGARGNNEIGICGVNWNLKIMMVSYDLHVSTLVEAYQYVLDMRKKYNESQGEEGAFVVAVNLSSGREYSTPESFPLWCAMYDSLGKVGILSVCSASNLNHSADKEGDLPSRCTSPYTIIVTNMNTNDEIHNAGYGRISVDIGAPGEQSLTTDTSNTYSYFRGTSAAAPHVAGAVGLMYSMECPIFFENLYTDPSEITLRIKNALLSSATPNSSLQGITLTGGRLQVDSALKTVLQPCIGEIDQNISIRFIAPNPARHNSAKVFFETTSDFSNIFLDFYSADGKLLISRNVTFEEFEQGYVIINTGPLQNGLYIASLRTSQDITSAKFLVY